MKCYILQELQQEKKILKNLYEKLKRLKCKDEKFDCMIDIEQSREFIDVLEKECYSLDEVLKYVK